MYFLSFVSFRKGVEVDSTMKVSLRVCTFVNKCYSHSPSVQFGLTYVLSPSSTHPSPCLSPPPSSSCPFKIPAGADVPKNAWVPVVELEPKGPATHAQSTQTQGLFYPSARTISEKKGGEIVRRAIQSMARDRLVRLDTWSAGKGRYAHMW